jgi:mycothiol synthase
MIDTQMTIDAQRVDTPAFSYVIRRTEERDLADLAEFYNENERNEPTSDEYEPTTVKDLQHWRNDPRSKDNIWWIVRLLNGDGNEGEIIGQVEFERHPGEEHASGGFFVHRDYRNHGLGTQLYNMIEQMTRAQEVAILYSDGSPIHKLKQEFLARRGFEFDRYFWEMRLTADKQTPTPQLPEGYTVRTFVRGRDEELFMLVRNISFAEHFGSIPYPLETATYLTEQENFQPEGLFFAFKDGEIAGYCWASISEEEIANRKMSVGWIHHLGTVPGHRGVGLGRALLLIGIQHLRQRVQIVELGMEGKNAAALKLYESVGFYQQKAWANMVKDLGKENNASN